MNLDNLSQQQLKELIEKQEQEIRRQEQEINKRSLEIKKLIGGGLGAALISNDKDMLCERDSDEIKDGYQLKFIGKDYAKFQAGLKTETVIVPDTEHNEKPENKNSSNIFITGDNLDALKHLENAYTGKIDVIYIDPPYNTGNNFVYKNDFGFTDDDLAQKLGLSSAEIARIKSLDGKCSHSAWLTFILPRLMIAKRLLKDSGYIVIAIDDNELYDLKLLCDQIFVETNYVGTIVTRCNPQGRGKNNIDPVHEYHLIYAKDNICSNGFFNYENTTIIRNNCQVLFL